jgi:hypothetical protein
VPHSFHHSLERSASYVDAPWWNDVYRQAFPDMEACVAIRDDGWAQRAGIDRQILLRCGRVVAIDEKVREKDYGDILIEIYSDEARKTPGWARKPLKSDFIAYAVAPSAICYLLPVLPLQRAWKQNAAQWWPMAKANQNGFAIKKSENFGWITCNVAVPTRELYRAMAEASIIRWQLPPPPAEPAELQQPTLPYVRPKQLLLPLLGADS